VVVFWVAPFSLEVAVFQEASHALCDSGSALIVGNDVSNYLAQLLKIDLVGPQKSLRGLRVTQNRGEGLIQLVHESPGTFIQPHQSSGQKHPTAPVAAPLCTQHSNQCQLRTSSG
jgi:hypothetical protein